MGIMENLDVIEGMGISRRIVGGTSRNCEVPARLRRRGRTPLYAGRNAHERTHRPRTTGFVRLTVALVPTPLSRELVPELHCIQAIENIGSIMERGILSHDLAAAIPHRSVAMQQIQDRRAKVTVRGTDRRLHSYANLYINGRNKMMYKLARYTNGVSPDQLCLLKISADVLDLPGVVIADRNAAADLVRFDPSPAGLANIVKELVYATYWNHDTEAKTLLHGQLVCAEVLVPDTVAAEYVVGAYVSCDESADRVLDAVDDDEFTVTVKPGMFFE